MNFAVRRVFDEYRETGPDTKLCLSVLFAGVALALLALVCGSAPTALLVFIATACIAQGLWRGALDILGLLLASLFALLLGPSIGRALETSIAAVSGNAGLLNRAVSIGLGVVAVLLVFSFLFSLASRSLLLRSVGTSSRRASINKWIGGVFGGLYGVVLGIVVLWVPLALEPIARIQVEGSPDPVWPRRVLDLSSRIKRSAIGSVAVATNPASDSRLLAIAADFARISRNEEALTALLASPPMTQLRDLPSVQAAMRSLEADPAVSPYVKGDVGITAQALLELANSPGVLLVLDNAQLLNDVTPIIPHLEAEITKAAAMIPPPR